MTADKPTSHQNGKPDRQNAINKEIENESKNKPNILKRASDTIVRLLESVFAKLGRLIGLHPVKTLLICVLLVGLCGIGMLEFTETTDNQTIWVPANSEVITHKNWVESNFPPSTRFVNVIFEAENILTPTSLKAMFDFYNKTLTLKTANGKNITSLCQKVAFGQCLVSSILELWLYNGTVINNLNEQEIINKIHTAQLSANFKRPFDIKTMIGDRRENSSRHIVSAAAASMTWILLGNDKEEVAAWEKLIINLAQQRNSDVTLYVYATRSFSDVGGNAILSDVTFLSAGYFLVIFYVIIVLGRFNCLEQRAWLAFCGICVIGLSILCSFGISSAAGWEYGPLHSVLPFLLLGIGVDDIFVIVGALTSLTPEESAQPIHEKMSLMLRHAGVSITVTSLTDIVAFGIGATTALPALKSFCIYASIGILVLYLLSATFFVAGVTLDVKRTEAKRNACCCFKHDEQCTTNKCSKKELLPLFIGKVYAPFLLKVPVKVLVLVVTAGILGVNIWGTISLKQEFDSRLFLPSDSYAFKYFEKNDRYFPNDGTSAAVYCGNINYFESRSKFENLTSLLSASRYVNNGTVDSWFQWYTDTLKTESNTSVTSLLDGNSYPNNSSLFVSILHSYTSSNVGLRYKPNLVLIMNNTVISASAISFEHEKFGNSAEQIEGMDGAQAIVQDIFPTCFTYGRQYLQWYTNKIIQKELYRNLALAAGCVFIVTLILIANLWTSLMVFTCVIGTLVDVAGCMYFWGLNIDTVTSIILILAIGLAVDYSAHIGHSFMTIRGSRNDRVKSTLVEIGSPVFSGGFSTFLAFILLVASNSYVFTTFFKVFLLVVVFGLFHGLVYLPTILSWIGPQPYLSAVRQTKHGEAETANTNRNSLHGSDNRAMEAELQVRRPSSQMTYDKIDYDNIGHGHPYIPPPDYTPPPSQTKRTELNNRLQKSRNSSINNGEVPISKKQSGPKSERSLHNGMPNVNI